MDLPELIVGKRVDPMMEAQGSPQPDDHNPDGHTNPVHAPAIVRDLSQLAAMGKLFSTVYADPPWPYSNTASRAAAENHYRTMTLDAIRNEPVKSVSAENSHLHLWTTNAFLREAFDVMHDWGFKYKSCLIWVKPQLGMGNYWLFPTNTCCLGFVETCPFGATKFAAGNQHAAPLTVESRSYFAA